MLDNILNTVRQGVEHVQRRGEELTQVARLRVEVFQLTRDLDGHFARLGRAYHSGADTDLLQGIQEDIRRVESDIRAREQLITELGDEEGAERNSSEGSTQVVSAVPAKERLIELSKANAGGAASSPASPAPETTEPPASATSTATVPASNRPAFVDELLDSPSADSSSPTDDSKKRSAP